MSEKRLKIMILTNVVVKLTFENLETLTRFFAEYVSGL